MKGSLFILSIILLLESIVLFGLGGGLAVNAVLFTALVVYVLCQLRWPEKTVRFHPFVAVCLLLAMLYVHNHQAGLMGYLMVYILFIHAFAWMIGFGACWPVGDAGKPRSLYEGKASWMYTEAFWLVVIPAYLAIERNLSTLPYVPGLLLGLVLLVLAFFLWESARKVISLPIRGAAGEFPARSVSIYVLLLTLLGLAIMVATPVSHTIPGAVEFSRMKVEGWIEQRRLRELAEQQLAQQKPKPIPGAAAEASGGESQAGFTLFPELPRRSSLGAAHREDIFLHLHNPDALGGVGQGRLYLRGLSFVHYRDNRWFPLRIVGTWHNDIDDGEPDGLIRIAPARAEPILQTVFLNQAHTRVLFALPGLTAVHMTRLYEAAEQCYMFPDSETLKVSYTVRSVPWFYDQIPDDEVRFSAVPPAYYEIPSLPVMPRISGLAQRVAPPDLSLPDRIEACRAYLRDNYSYSREISNPTNLPPLENFLFNERRGYCDFYASSLVFMLRSLGMPARMSGGYAGGVYDAENEVQVFYSDHAHSWTEIPIDGYGWVVLDATAENVVVPRSRAPAPATSVSLDDFEHISTEVLEAEDEAAGGFDVSWAFDSFQRVQIYLLGGLLLVVLGVLLMALVRYLRGRRAIRTQLNAERDVPELGFYAEICHMFKLVGHPRKPSQTPREYLKRLRRVGYYEEILETLTDYVYAVSYRGGSRNKAREETFVDAAQRLLKAREATAGPRDPSG